MAELGEGGAIGSGGHVAGTDSLVGGPKIPPWRLPENWTQGPVGGGPRPPNGYGGQPGYGAQTGYGGGPGYGYGASAGGQPYGGYPAAGGYTPTSAQQTYSQPGFDPQAAYAQYYQTLQQSGR